MTPVPTLPVRPAPTQDIQKIARRVSTGETIETADGRRFFVAAKLAGPRGPSFRLTTPTSSTHVTARQLAEMDPLPAPLARIARLLRVYAFNRDFDQYVKDAIRAEGLAVDPNANWARFFQKIYRPMLADYMRSKGIRPSEEVIDEAIHATIIDALIFRRGLSRFRPSSARGESKRTGEKYNEAEARQVTKFLSHLFEFEKTRAKREIIRLTNVVPTIHSGKKPAEGEPPRSSRGLATPMERPKPGQPEETYNILETEEFASGHPSSEWDVWEDVARFRAAYGEWLEDREGEAFADNILKLLDFVVQAAQRSGGREADLSDYRDLWMSETGKSLSYFQLTRTALADTLQDFTEEHPELAETHPLARVIDNIRGRKPSTQHRIEGLKPAPVAASLRMAAAAPSDLATIPGDTGGIPHDNTGKTDSSVIVLEQKPPEQPRRTVNPEVPVIRHGA